MFISLTVLYFSLTDWPCTLSVLRGTSLRYWCLYRLRSAPNTCSGSWCLITSWWMPFMPTAHRHRWDSGVGEAVKFRESIVAILFDVSCIYFFFINFLQSHPVLQLITSVNFFYHTKIYTKYTSYVLWLKRSSMINPTIINQTFLFPLPR